MPMLPSGRHIALDAAALVKVLEQCGSPGNVHLVMAMQTLDDLFPWIDVTSGEAAESLAPEQRQVAVELQGAPPGIVGVATGLKLSQWRHLASGWSDADRQGAPTDRLSMSRWTSGIRMLSQRRARSSPSTKS